MKRLSKTQEETLLILAEGAMYHNLQDDSVSLEDADHNWYLLRRNTFRALKRNNMLKQGHPPNIDTDSYLLSNDAISYLMKYRKKDLI